MESQPSLDHSDDHGEEGWVMHRTSSPAMRAIRHNMLCCSAEEGSKKSMSSSSKSLREPSSCKGKVFPLPAGRQRGLGSAVPPISSQEKEVDWAKHTWEKNTSHVRADGSASGGQGIGSRLYATIARKGVQLAGKLGMRRQMQGPLRSRFFQFDSGGEEGGCCNQYNSRDGDSRCSCVGSGTIQGRRSDRSPPTCPHSPSRKGDFAAAAAAQRWAQGDSIHDHRGFALPSHAHHGMPGVGRRM